ncbi:MAG: hypothetical protein WCD43_18085 [Candidatus Acidiferrales bacterium]
MQSGGKLRHSKSASVMECGSLPAVAGLLPLSRLKRGSMEERVEMERYNQKSLRAHEKDYR